ncbi:MAG: hypothetical protein ACFFCW_00110 [Candidatus Hodarchaeota archaeon]
MPKTEQILNYFPDHYYAGDPDKILYHVVNVLASKLEDDENNLTRVLQSHWIRTIEEIIDLRRMAALFSDLGEPYDDGVVNGRERLAKIVRLYLGGPGTVRSIFEFSEIELARHALTYERNSGGEIVLRDESGYVLFDNIDGQNFISKAKLERKTETETGEEIEVFEVELEENPNLDFRYDQPKTLNRIPFYLNNNGFFIRYPKITVIGIKQRTTNFLILNISSGQAIGFRGRVNEGSTLSLTPYENGMIEEADLDSMDVVEQVYSLSGAQFDRDVYDEEERARFGERRPVPTYDHALFAGPEDDVPVFFQPPLEIHAPGIPIGESEWRFQVVPARFNASYFDQYVYAIPDVVKASYDAGRFDEAIYAIEPSAKISLEWQERERASFALKLPPEPFKTEQQREIVLERTRNIVNRIKPAGVKAEVIFRGDY